MCITLIANIAHVIRQRDVSNSKEQKNGFEPNSKLTIPNGFEALNFCQPSLSFKFES